MSKVTLQGGKYDGRVLDLPVGFGMVIVPAMCERNSWECFCGGIVEVVYREQADGSWVFTANVRKAPVPPPEPDPETCHQGTKWERCGLPPVATLVPPDRYDDETPRRYCEEHASARADDCRSITWDDGR